MDYGPFFDAGVHAAAAGQPETACPIRGDGSTARAWRAGWEFETEMQLEAARERGASDYRAGITREACPFQTDPAATAWHDGWTDTAARAEAEAAPPPEGRRIDLTPTWAGLMPALIALIDNGTPEGRAVAVAELQRLAEGMDAANKAPKEG